MGMLSSWWCSTMATATWLKWVRVKKKKKLDGKSFLLVQDICYIINGGGTCSEHKLEVEKVQGTINSVKGSFCCQLNEVWCLCQTLLLYSNRHEILNGEDICQERNEAIMILLDIWMTRHSWIYRKILVLAESGIMCKREDSLVQRTSLPVPVKNV